MSWTAVVVTGEVDADYSQFELDLGDGGQVPGFTTAVGLATSNGEEHVVLIVARQYGVDVFVGPARGVGVVAARGHR